MKEKAPTRPPLQGVACALLAALLFGASAPLAKMLVGEIHPIMLAGLLYLGSGIGLTLWKLLSKSKEAAKIPVSSAQNCLPPLQGQGQHEPNAIPAQDRILSIRCISIECRTLIFSNCVLR